MQESKGIEPSQNCNMQLRGKKVIRKQTRKMMAEKSKCSTQYTDFQNLVRNLAQNDLPHHKIFTRNNRLNLRETVPLEAKKGEGLMTCCQNPR